MIREKYESLAVHDLKEIAKARGIKGLSTMKKAEVIDAMLRLDAQENAEIKTERSVPENRPAERKDAPEKGIAERKDAPKRDAAEREDALKRGAAESKDVPEKGAAEREDVPKRGAAEKQDSHDGGTEPESKAGDREERRQQRTARRSGSLENGHREGDGERSHRTYRQNNSSYNNGSSGSNGSYNNNARTGSRDNNGARENTAAAAPRAAAPVAEEAQNRVSAPAPRYNERYNSPYNRGTAPIQSPEEDKFPTELDSGITVKGILEVMAEGYGFIRSDNYMPGENDIYVAPSQIRRFNLRTGDILEGNTRVRTQNEKFSALLYVKTINGYTTEEASRRSNFEDMTPIFPNSRLKMERFGCPVAMRVMDLLSPIGKGQRGMIVSPPKAGKTTLLKEVAMSVKKNYPDLHLIILLIDERPEEVTDMKETVAGPNVEVIYSTFDELPEHHKRVSEMVIERAKRLVEHKKDVMILLDSITRLTRAYNLVVPPSGRTLSGGIDPAALHMPKRFFGAARNMREGGSLTILATALVDTGSRMDDVIYEEFKGTGNMELVLDRKLSERRIFPAIDIPKTSTRREDLLLSAEEMEAINVVRRALNGMKSDEAVDKVLDLFAKTKTNTEFVQTVRKMRYL